ncbi:MAG: hypothetical protein P9M14_07450 [Candidatus Alcyoniella australis]|nr:hypothetical protein [Candidatus Alcyoniella australis]
MSFDGPAGLGRALAARRGMTALAIYLLRLALLCFCVSEIGFNALSARLDLGLIDPLFDILGQFDLYRAAFYGTLPAFLLLLLLPRNGPADLRGTHWGALCPALGIVAGALPAVAISIARPDVPPSPWLAVPCALIGLNVWVLCRVHWAGRLSEGGRKLLLRLAVMADVLLPLPLWSASSARRPLLFAWLRPIPALIVCSSVLVPLLLLPRPVTDFPRIDPALSQLQAGSYYKLELDSRDGALLLARDDIHHLVRVDPLRPDDVRDIGPIRGGIQGLALDQDVGRVLLITLAVGRSLVLDAVSLKTISERSTSREFADQTLIQTFWEARRQILFTLSNNAIVLFCPDGVTVRARFNMGQATDALIDPQRDEIHVNSHWLPEKLLALDPRTLEVKRSVHLPRFGERMALDREGDRLFVTHPIAGSVSVVDLTDYRLVHELRAFPGVRAVGVDPQRRLLLLGGFSPIIELRSLDDFSLVARLAAPPWMRFIKVDSGAGRAYVTTNGKGVWQLDLERALSSHCSALQRIDPFYLVAGPANRLMQILLDWHSGEEAPTGIYGPPEIFIDDCPGDLWTAQVD